MRLARVCALSLVAVVALPSLSRAAPKALDAAAIGKLVDRIVAAYGGRTALERVSILRETGHVTSPMRGSAVADLVRLIRRPEYLRVEVRWPGEPPEVRTFDGKRALRGTAEVTGPPRLAMALQTARMDLPLLLARRHAEVVDRGRVELDGKQLRRLTLPLSDKMAIFVDVDETSGHILRSVGLGPAGDDFIEFETRYDDFRTVAGVLIPFHERGFAMGTATGDTRLDKVEPLPSLPE